MTIGEKAGEVLSLLMEKLVPEKTGKEFSDECIEILTLSISQLIKSSHCRSCYDDILNKAMVYIIEDLEQEEDKDGTDS